ncbi:hypothetical protein SLE2022_131700 [Rubroshorea leprosula]
MDFRAFPNCCLAAIISFTSPLDACRLSLVSTDFKSAADSDIVWDKFLPADYRSLIPALPPTTSKKELFLSLCDNPVLIEDGKMSLSLEKRSGKKCYMLGARSLEITWGDTPAYWKWISVPDSRVFHFCRFNEVTMLRQVWWFEIRGKISTSILSPATRYKAYIVLKLTDNAYGLENLPFEAYVGPVGLAGVEKSCTRTVYVGADRIDNWFEVELGEFFNGIRGEDGELEISMMEIAGHYKCGLIVQGIGIRPVTNM